MSLNDGLIAAWRGETMDEPGNANFGSPDFATLVNCYSNATAFTIGMDSQNGIDVGYIGESPNLGHMKMTVPVQGSASDYTVSMWLFANAFYQPKISQIQRIEFDATGGTFDLYYGIAGTLFNVAYDISDLDLQNMFEGFLGGYPDSVLVTTVEAGPNVVIKDIMWKGALAGQYIPVTSINTSNLTGNTYNSITQLQTPGVSQIQKLEFDATDGVFDLSYTMPDSNPTVVASLTYDIDDMTLQNYLINSGPFPEGSVVVTSEAGGPNVVIKYVEWTGIALYGMSIPITLDVTNLVGNTYHQVTETQSAVSGKGNLPPTVVSNFAVADDDTMPNEQIYLTESAFEAGRFVVNVSVSDGVENFWSDVSDMENPFMDTSWYNLTYTNDGTNVKCYVNGVLAVTVPSYGPDRIAYLNIGGTKPGGFSNSSVSPYARIYAWNRVLTETEISDLHTNGASMTLPVEEELNSSEAFWAKIQKTMKRLKKLLKKFKQFLNSQ